MSSSSVNSSSGDSTGTSNSSSTPSILPFLQDLANFSAGLASQTYDWASNTFNNNSMITDANVQSYLATSAAALKQAQSDTSRYQNLFQPQENNLVADANSYASPARIQNEMGSAEAGTGQAMDAGRQNAERDLQSFGIDPSSGRYAELEQASQAQKAAAQAGAGQQAQRATEATGRALRSEAIQVGERYPGQIINSLNTGLQGISGAENATLANANTGASMFSAAAPFIKFPSPSNTSVGTSQQQSQQRSAGSSGSRSPDNGSQSKGPPTGGGGAGNRQASNNGNSGGSGQKSNSGQPGMLHNPSQPTPGDPNGGGDTAWTNNGQPGMPDPWTQSQTDQTWGTPDQLGSGGGSANPGGYGGSYDPTGGGNGGNPTSPSGFSGSGGPGQYGGGSYDPTGGGNGGNPAPSSNYGGSYDATGGSNYGGSGGNPGSYSSGGGSYGGGYYAKGGSVQPGQFAGSGAGGAGRSGMGGGAGRSGLGGGSGGAGRQFAGRVSPQMSPSHGAQTDDVPMPIGNGGGPGAHLNAGEFVVPEDVAKWKGHEFFQKMIQQSRKARMGAPAKPSRQMGQ